jgi:hypothetical protein
MKVTTTIGTRENRGKAIASQSDQIKNVKGHQFIIKSRRGHGSYEIKETDYGVTCTCKDFKT